jgi:hypothetical protein
VEQWRFYEPWLTPLKSVLSPVLAAWPDVPDIGELNGSPIDGGRQRGST